MYIILICLIVFFITITWYYRATKVKYYKTIRQESLDVLAKLIRKYKKNQSISLNKNNYSKSFPKLTMPSFRVILAFWIILCLVTVFVLDGNFLVWLLIFVSLPLIFYILFKTQDIDLTNAVIKKDQLIIYTTDGLIYQEYDLKQLKMTVTLVEDLKSTNDYLLYINEQKPKLRAVHQICDQADLIAFLLLIYLINNKDLNKFDVKKIDDQEFKLLLSHIKTTRRFKGL